MMRPEWVERRLDSAPAQKRKPRNHVPRPSARSDRRERAISRSELVVHLQAADDGLVVKLESAETALSGIDSRASEIDKQAFQPDGPVPAQHVLHAAANGPAGLCLRARVGNTVSERKEGDGIFDTAEGNAGRHVGHGVTDRKPEARAHRAQ